MKRLFLFVAIAAIGAWAPARADNWTIAKLEGEAMVSKGGTWTKLARNDVISDASPLRTLSTSLVLLERDHEKILMLSDTQIRISDKIDRRFTTVEEQFGTVAVEANGDMAEHFQVKTKQVSAASRGAIFAVSGELTHSTVGVNRGDVDVMDMVRTTHLDVPAGKEVTVGKTQRAVLKDFPHELTDVLKAGAGPGPEMDALRAIEALAAQDPPADAAPPPASQPAPADAAKASGPANAPPSDAAGKFGEAAKRGVELRGGVKPEATPAPELRGALAPGETAANADPQARHSNSAKAGNAAKFAAASAGPADVKSPTPESAGAPAATSAKASGDSNTTLKAAAAGKTAPPGSTAAVGAKVPKAAAAAAGDPNKPAGPKSDASNADAPKASGGGGTTPLDGAKNGASTADAAAVRTAVDQGKAALGDGDAPHANPDEIKSAMAAAGIKGGKFSASQVAQGAQVAGAVIETMAPDLTPEEQTPESNHKVVAARLLDLIVDQDAFGITIAVMAILAVFFGVGMLLNAILGDVGFGAAGNALVALLGSFVGALVRDKFLFDAGWFALEPYVSILTITSFATAAILGACVLRYRALVTNEAAPVRAAAMAAPARRTLSRERFIK